MTICDAGRKCKAATRETCSRDTARYYVEEMKRREKKLKLNVEKLKGEEREVVEKIAYFVPVHKQYLPSATLSLHPAQLQPSPNHI